MKRLLLAMLVLGLASGAARADWGGMKGPSGAAPGGSAPSIGAPNTLLGPSEPYNGIAPDKYGLHPRIKRLFNVGGARNYPQMGYGQNGPAYNPGAYPPAQGTLVFPNHPYVRSPRDYFMLELNK